MTFTKDKDKWRSNAKGIATTFGDRGVIYVDYNKQSRRLVFEADTNPYDNTLVLTIVSDKWSNGDEISIFDRSEINKNMNEAYSEYKKVLVIFDDK